MAPNTRIGKDAPLVIGKSGNRVMDHKAAAAAPFDYPMTGLRNYPNLQSGFTLIELMVVLSLIIVLASVGLVQYRQSIIHTNEAVLKDDLVKMRDALDQYYADKNQWPESLSALVSDGYVR